MSNSNIYRPGDFSVYNKQGVHKYTYTENYYEKIEERITVASWGHFYRQLTSNVAKTDKINVALVRFRTIVLVWAPVSPSLKYF